MLHRIPQGLRPRTSGSGLLAFSAAAVSLLAFGCSGAGPDAPVEQAGSTSAALIAPTPFATEQDLVNLANANIGGMACKTNSLGGSAFESSCTGNGGLPEYWCADFVEWVWAKSGVDVSGIDAAAGSFYVYGQNHGTLSNTPTLGAAVVFDYQGGGVADHVAIVTKINSDGTIESVSGDWDGQSGSEATFASTSHVVLNAPAYSPTVGGTPSVIGMTVSGYIRPVGVTEGYAAGYVGQSFPLASTALKMTAGQTMPAWIEMKNTGGKAWDSNTRLATSNPRDRASVFADSSWISPNRLAAVSGTVAPGSTFKFQFNLHAPSKPGTYYEYFNLVEENVAWFSDPGQGGPPDNDLEVQVLVEPAPDAGTPPPESGDAGAPAPGEDAGSPAARDGGGVKAPPPAPGTGPSEMPGDGTGTGGGLDTTSASGGCAMTRTAPAGGAASSVLALVGIVLVLRRRRH